jgi:hypothetical protein
MAEVIVPEYLKYIAAERHGNRFPIISQPLDAGEIHHPVFIKTEKARELLRVAARRACGFFRPTQRKEVVWVVGESELAVVFSELSLKVDKGLLLIFIPVHCDQTGLALIEVVFAVGSSAQPSGLFASTYRRPNGPELIVSTWGESLVAFAWQCVLGMVTGIANATGKDSRGNLLVPVEMIASEDGLEIFPMARHRFAGSSGLNVTAIKGGRQ